jgi:hypothetical protein
VFQSAFHSRSDLQKTSQQTVVNTEGRLIYDRQGSSSGHLETRVGGIVQVVEHLPSKYKALSSSPIKKQSTTPAMLGAHAYHSSYLGGEDQEDRVSKPTTKKVSETLSQSIS